MLTVGSASFASSDSYCLDDWACVEKTQENGAKNGAPRHLLAAAGRIRGADRKLRVQLLLLGRRLGLADRDRTRATGVVAPPAPPFLLLSHGEDPSSRPLSPRPGNVAAPKGPAFLFLKLLLV